MKITYMNDGQNVSTETHVQTVGPAGEEAEYSPVLERDARVFLAANPNGKIVIEN